MDTNKALELCVQMVHLVRERGINIEVVREPLQILGLDTPPLASKSSGQ